MPRHLNPCSYLPRRLQIVASLTLFVLLSILFLGSSSTDQYDPYLAAAPYGPKLQSGAHQAIDAAHNAVEHLPKLPKNVNTPSWLNPFGPAAHTPPPEQANSSSEDAKWFSDWKWQNPFSSSITLDEERSVLPPEQSRPPIYTYFELTSKKTDEGKTDEKTRKAERELLEIWRRAWWAKGFKPVVLGVGEARNNPLYRTLMGKELDEDIEFELQRWLAWGNMGSGILCNWLALPMAAYDDPLLAFLRRGEYPTLTRYEGLDAGLFVGPRSDIDAAIKKALANPKLSTAKSIVDAVPADTFTLDAKPSGIAFYSTSTLKSLYPLFREKLSSSPSDALALLPQLLTSHLHLTWQGVFTSGIAVLKPLPAHTTTLITPAIELARTLSQCPKSPLPASCPPNMKKCRPCVATHEPLITTPPVWRNTSTLFTIATLPHPYTLTSLLHSRPSLDVRFIRRTTTRDPWTLAATKELLGTGLSASARLPRLKDAIASPYSSARTLWMPAETPLDISNPDDLAQLDWTLGFKLPRQGEALSPHKSETPVPGPERRPPPPKQEFEGPAPDETALALEERLVQLAKTVVVGRGSEAKALGKVKGVVEAWSLADAEVWRFVRALGERRRVEWRLWEEEERAFLGRGAWERFVDRVG